VGTCDGRRWRLAVLGIAVGALLLRATAVDRRALWYDEAVTAHLALSKSTRALARGEFIRDGEVRDRGNPPLYFLAVKAWTRAFGRSEAALRGLSVVGGVLVVPFLALLGRRFGGADVGLLAALLWAGSPLAVALAQEARSFSVLCLLVVINAWAFVRWLDERRALDLALYAVTLGLSMSTHYYALGLPAVHAFVLAAVPRGVTRVGGWLLALAGAVLLFLPWAPVFTAQVTLSNNLVRNAEHWLTQFVATPVFFSVGDNVPREPWTLALAAVVALTGFVLPAMWGLLRMPGPAWAKVLLGTWWLGPILGPALVSSLGGAVYSFRYAFIALPPFLVLASAGVVSFPRRLQRVAALSIAVATLIPLGHYYGAPSPRPDWRPVPGFLSSQARPRDLLLVDATSQTVVFLYYARERAYYPQRLFGLERPQPATPELPCRTYEAASLRYRAWDDCTPSILGHDGIWLALAQGHRLPQYYLTFLGDRGYKRLAVHEFSRIQIWEFRREVRP